MKITHKPEPTIQEFTDLAKIVMEEENLDIPTTPQEALALYIDNHACSLFNSTIGNYIAV